MFHIGSITAEEVSAKLREMMTDENRTIIVQGLDAPDVKHLSEAEARAIIDKVNTAKLTPYEDKTAGTSLVAVEPEPAAVIKTVELPQFNAVEWTLANKTKVVFRKADYEKDNITLSAYSFGGLSKLDNDMVLAGELMPTIIGMYGAGDFDNVTIQKMLSGKKASVSLSLAEITENISGSSTPKDFETMMQLLWLKLAKPRFDQQAHDAIVGRFAAMIASQEKNPEKIKSDSIELITTGYNPRTILLTKDNVSKISLDQVKKIFYDRFNGADEFTFFIVGNIDKDAVLPLVRKYIGTLPMSNRKETWIDRKVNQPEGKITKEIAIPLTIPKSTVYISTSANLKYNQYDYLGMQVIKGILDLVYTEKVREDQGGTYGVRVGLSVSKMPEQKAEGAIMFDCNPDRANFLKSIIYNQIDTLVKFGPTQVNLEKTVNNLLKTREENKMHNNYWMSVLNKYYMYGIDANDPKNFENIVKAYKVNDIKKLAGKVFTKADMVDLIFKPAK